MELLTLFAIGIVIGLLTQPPKGIVTMSNNLSRLTSRQLWRKVDHITAVILKFLTIVVVLVGLFVIVKVEATSNDVKTVRIDGGVDVNRPAQLNKPYETVVRLEDGSVKHCIVNGTGALSCNM